MARLVIRCGSPDCEWGYPVPHIIDPWISECRVAFKQHCIDLHQLPPGDTDRLICLNLLDFTLTRDS